MFCMSGNARNVLTYSRQRSTYYNICESADDIRNDTTYEVILLSCIFILFNLLHFFHIIRRNINFKSHYDEP